MDTNELIIRQDRALQSLMNIHKHDNPEHIINKYNNFINCSCKYHVHAINENLVIHNSRYTKFEIIPL
jgi:hypothetical protein